MKALTSGWCLLSFCAVGASGLEETGRVELLPITHRRNPLFQLRCEGRESDNGHLDFLQPRVLCVKLFSHRLRARLLALASILVDLRRERLWAVSVFSAFCISKVDTKKLSQNHREDSDALMLPRLPTSDLQHVAVEREKCVRQSSACDDPLSQTCDALDRESGALRFPSAQTVRREKNILW